MKHSFDQSQQKTWLDRLLSAVTRNRVARALPGEPDVITQPGPQDSSWKAYFHYRSSFRFRIQCYSGSGATVFGNRLPISVHNACPLRALPTVPFMATIQHTYEIAVIRSFKTRQSKAAAFQRGSDGQTASHLRSLRGELPVRPPTMHSGKLLRTMRRTQPAILVVFGAIALMNVARSPRFEAFHKVDVLGLMAAGACFGVAFALFLRMRQPKLSGNEVTLGEPRTGGAQRLPTCYGY